MPSVCLLPLYCESNFLPLHFRKSGELRGLRLHAYVIHLVVMLPACKHSELGAFKTLTKGCEIPALGPSLKKGGLLHGKILLH